MLIGGKDSNYFRDSQKKTIVFLWFALKSDLFCRSIYEILPLKLCVG